MGRSEGLYPPPGHGKPTKENYTSVILGALNHLNKSQQDQYVVIIVDTKGNVTLETSKAFKPKIVNWFPNSMIQEAVDITLSTANSSGSKSRRRIAEFDEDQGRIKTFKPMVQYENMMGSGGRDEISGYGNPEHEHKSELPSPPPGLYGNPRIRDKRPLAIDTQLSKKRRRSTSNQGHHPSGSDSPESGVITTRNDRFTTLIISDEQAVTAFFETRFRQMQQLTCKVVAKAWIKVIEPKKQSNFPYNRGEESKPAWWPEGARHKEPDHLMKPERLRLLMTMLRCRKVDIAKLEMATDEVKGHIEQCRLGLLDEVYKIAKMEERYTKGLLPADTECYVAASAEKITTKAQTPKPTPQVIDASEASPVHSPSSVGSLGTPEAMPLNSSMPGRHDRMDLPSHTQQHISTSGSLRGVATSYGARPQGGAEPLQSPMFGSSYMSSPSTPQEYMGEGQSINGYPFGRPAPFGNSLPIPRRAQSIPQAPYGWSVHMQAGGYPQYGQQNSPHSPDSPHPLNNYQTNAAPSYSPLHPLRPLPPPIQQAVHQHHHNPHATGPRHSISGSISEDRAQYDTSRMSSQINSFSDFLAAPIPDMGGVPASSDNGMDMNQRITGGPSSHNGGMPH